VTNLYARAGKRCLDVALAVVALVALSPLLLLVAVLVRLEDGGRVVFRQRRVGRDQQTFELLKFRSMRTDVGDVQSSEAQSLPITRIGRVIRRMSVDELPQLINILRGEMSIVGPRPPIPSQHELIALREASGAFSVRPGLTGLAQVSGYDGMPNAEKAACDAEYAREISLRRDLRIIWRTLAYLRRIPPVY
jgi:O-antigen biosynthesis protein WbqP